MKKQNKLNRKTGNRKYIIFMFSLFVISFPIKAKDFVIISEIMYDTPLNEQIATGVAYSNGEYVELYNAGIETVNLTGWYLHGGGSTETYYFATGTVLAPKSYIIVAYQYNNSNFTLDQLYSGVVATSEHQIQYQHKILLSNSGEPVYLRDNTGITKDSIYYDGTSNKTKPNRLSAENTDGLSGNSCVSIQRKTAFFTSAGSAVSNNSEWGGAVVNPFQLNTLFVPAVLPGYGVSYMYDAAGNRTSRKVVELNGPSNVKRQDGTEDVPLPISEKAGKMLVTVYPNPTRGELAVQISGIALPENASITVYNSLGKMLLHFYAVEDISNFDMSAYPSGWYLLRVIAGENYTEFKIIKQ